MEKELSIQELLQEVLKITGAKYTRNGCYESNKYFIYIGHFPVDHVALDDKSGTIRKYTITKASELKQIK